MPHVPPSGSATAYSYAYYRCLASLLSDKWTDHYVGWIRCCLSFSLLCSAIRCLGGSCTDPLLLLLLSLKICGADTSAPLLVWLQP